MFNKIVWHILALWFAIIFYDVFLSRMPFDAIVVSLVLLAIVSHWRTTVLWTALLGIFLDGSTPLPPGILLLSLIMVTSVTLILIRIFFPHGSLWTAAFLAFFGTFLLEVSQAFWQYFLYWTGTSIRHPGFPEWRFLMLFAVWNTLATLGGFLLIHLLSKRLSPSFLSLNRREFLWRS